MAVKVDGDSIKILSGYDWQEHGLSEAQLTMAISVALSRLQVWLCDDTLTADAMPDALAPALADLIVWGLTNKATAWGIDQETVENYSYTVDHQNKAVPNFLMRLREKYGDLYKVYSKCQSATIENAKSNPLWTPDYYRENRGEQ